MAFLIFNVRHLNNTADPTRMPTMKRATRHAGPPASTATLRSANQRRVLAELRSPSAEARPGDLTQAELARATGLAPATISSIVRELASAGVVETRPGSGRRGTTVWFSQKAGVVAGVDFGHTHLSVAVADLTASVIGSRRIDIAPDHPSDDGLHEASAILRDLMAEANRSSDELLAIGLGLPVPIAQGVVRSTAILPGWVGVHPRRTAEELWGVPVHVENDANLGALAEHRRGAARGHSDVVVIKISSGIGAGIIVDGRILRGSAGTAGEIGHLTLNDQGPVCRCGSRGCLETYVSTSTVQSMLAGQLPGASLERIVAAAKGGSVPARRALEDTGLHLGWGIASTVNLLNPDLVVIGGEMAIAGDLLLQPARVALRRHALDVNADTPLVPGVHGDGAALLGAVLLAAESAELTV